MSRIAAPMIGGMITAPLLSLFIIPAAYKLMWLHRHRGQNNTLKRAPAFGFVAEAGAALYLQCLHAFAVLTRRAAKFP